MKANIHRLLELQQLLLVFSQVERRNHRKHNDQYIRENDTEHSYNLAMTAWYLAQWFPDLNKDLIIQYALVHDLVETP
jgi:5'-deoxynucleotidase YfbR-like HD superfamily hydrolase